MPGESNRLSSRKVNANKLSKATERSGYRDKKTDSGVNFYSSRKWRTFREKHKKKQRKKDMKWLIEHFSELENATLRAKEYWMNKSKYPLCKKSLKRGLIREGNIFDHKIPWQSGDTHRERQRLKWSEDNLWWINEREHDRKSATEDKKYYED